MSLTLLLPEPGVTDLMTWWPDDPRVYQRDRGTIDTMITSELLNEYIDTGCVPAAEIAAMKASPSINPLSFQTNGRTDAAKLRRLYELGYTIRLGNLQRVIPALAHLCHAIHGETGYSNYVHAFLTPPGNQGLLHHWDQQMAIIVQLAGTKRWELWRPPVDSPMREYNESFRVWKDNYIPQWTAAGPDMTVDLKAGESLLLPRGWVHNPHALDSDEHSIHLTVAIRERTPFWLAEKLLAGAIEHPAFREIILPDDLNGDSLANKINNTRRMLIEHLANLDPDDLAPSLRQAALTELEYAT